MLKRLKIVDPTIAIGVIISIATSIILVLIGQDEVLSLLTGLLITVITLLIDVIARVKESEVRLLTHMVLHDEIIKDQFLLGVIRQITTDYSVVKGLKQSFFEDRAKRSILECRNIVHDLAEGRMIVKAEQSTLSYGNKARKTVKVVLCNILPFWRSKYGAFVIQKNAKAIARGVKFTHVWIHKPETLLEYRDIMYKFNDVGVNIKVAEITEVPQYLIASYRIIDDEKLIKLEVEGNDRWNEQIIINPITVEKAVYEFDLLLQYTHSLKDYFDKKALGITQEAAPK